MEILRRYVLAALIGGMLLSCAEDPVENNENFLSGEWVIEEIFVDLDLPPTLIEEDTTLLVRDEVAIPDELLITQILYSREEGVFANEFDFTDELELADSYIISLNDEGLYTLDIRPEFGSNVLEFFFEDATPLFIESFFPPVEDLDEQGNGNYQYELEEFTFFLDYAYFSTSVSSDGSFNRGIWETVNLGEQVLFDYTAPLYELGSNLWEIEILDDNNVILSQFGETSPELLLEYKRTSENQTDGVVTFDSLLTYYSNPATINNASIVLKRN